MTARKATAKQTAKKTTRAIAKKPAVGEAAESAAGAKQASAKQASAKQASAKQASAKQASAKQASAKQASSKRAGAKQATAKQASTKQAGAKRATVKAAKATVKQAGAKKASATPAARATGAKKVTARKPAAKDASSPTGVTMNQAILAAAGDGPRFWLMKSEPETFSIDDLERLGRTAWEGVRNYQARNHMRDDMRLGDPVLFYHSSTTPPGVVGLATVASAPYPDVTAFDPASPYHDGATTPDAPRWMLVDVAFLEKFAAPVPLELMRDDPSLQGMLLTQKGQRLSVQPVLRAHFERIVGLARSTRAAALLAPAAS